MFISELHILRMSCFKNCAFACELPKFKRIHFHVCLNVVFPVLHHFIKYHVGSKLPEEISDADCIFCDMCGCGTFLL